MPRPKFDHPTPGELRVLRILWDRGASSGRDVMELLNKDGADRAYTSVTSLLNVMNDKGLVRRTAQGRAFVYAAKVKQDKTQRGLLHDLMGRAFEGSASALVASLLGDLKLSEEELHRIRQIIEERTGM